MKRSNFQKPRQLQGQIKYSFGLTNPVAISLIRKNHEFIINTDTEQWSEVIIVVLVIWKSFNLHERTNKELESGLFSVPYFSVR